MVSLQLKAGGQHTQVYFGGHTNKPHSMPSDLHSGRSTQWIGADYIQPIPQQQMSCGLGPEIQSTQPGSSHLPREAANIQDLLILTELTIVCGHIVGILSEYGHEVICVLHSRTGRRR